MLNNLTKYWINVDEDLETPDVVIGGSLGEVQAHV